MNRSRLTVLVSGMIAEVPHQGGATWAVLQYVLGLRRLGHEVWFVEPVDRAALTPAGTPFDRSVNAAYFRSVARAFGLENSSAILLAGTSRTVGVSYERLQDAARRAALLINVSGRLADASLTERIPVRAYLDLDPGFTQLWQEVEGIDMRFAGHTHFVTVGLAVGGPDCEVPTCGLSWIPTPPPVVLSHWPVGNGVVHDAFTTVANWRGYGSIEHGGVLYGQKAHSLRRFIEAPLWADERFLLALSIHPQERRDLVALAAHGWALADPAEVASTPDRYRRFVRGSKAEFGIAKSGYVQARCGWVSDRSVCYLASGRPVLAQDSGAGRFIADGEGFLTFSEMDDLLTGIESLRTDYRRHARAARALAESSFDSDRVLSSLLRILEVLP